MNRNKRQRDVPIDDNEKKKFVGTSSSLLPVDRLELYNYMVFNTLYFI